MVGVPGIQPASQHTYNVLPNKLCPNGRIYDVYGEGHGTPLDAWGVFVGEVSGGVRTHLKLTVELVLKCIF